MSKTVTVKYFATLREQRGTDSEVLSTDSISVSDLYRELKNEHCFKLNEAVVRAAVNDRFVDSDFALEDGATVVFIPPVAGG